MRRKRLPRPGRGAWGFSLCSPRIESFAHFSTAILISYRESYSLRLLPVVKCFMFIPSHPGGVHRRSLRSPCVAVPAPRAFSSHICTHRAFLTPFLAHSYAHPRISLKTLTFKFIPCHSYALFPCNPFRFHSYEKHRGVGGHPVTFSPVPSPGWRTSPRVG